MTCRHTPILAFSTLTYLFEGEIIHRDSLGTKQTIIPGDVNWMTAGRGIVHSERIDPKLREAHRSLHGIQVWVALPKSDEETDPTFEHYPAASIPHLELTGIRVNLIAGSAFGATSPVKIYSRLFYLNIHFMADSNLNFNPESGEISQSPLIVEGISGSRGSTENLLKPGRLENPENPESPKESTTPLEIAFYLMKGQVEINEQAFTGPILIVFKPGSTIETTGASKYQRAHFRRRPPWRNGGIYGGILSLLRGKGSSKPKKSGANNVSPKFPKRQILYHCPNRG